MELPFESSAGAARPTGLLGRESAAAARPAPKATFRPPGLMETAVVRDPFERVSPRLRCLEFFDREAYS